MPYGDTGETPGSPDADAADDRDFSDQWMLSAAGSSNIPIDLGIQIGVEFPFRLRLHASYGAVPSAFIGVLTGLTSDGGSSTVVNTLIDGFDGGHTWRFQAGVRPFGPLGFYGDIGYSRVSLSGKLAAAELDGLGGAGGYEAEAIIHTWLMELGYQAWLGDHVTAALALGFMKVTSSETTAQATGGARAVPPSASDVVDENIEEHGFVPTLSARFGFDVL